MITSVVQLDSGHTRGQGWALKAGELVRAQYRKQMVQMFLRRKVFNGTKLLKSCRSWYQEVAARTAEFKNTAWVASQA